MTAASSRPGRHFPPRAGHAIKWTWPREKGQFDAFTSASQGGAECAQMPADGEPSSEMVFAVPLCPHFSGRSQEAGLGP